MTESKESRADLERRATASEKRAQGAETRLAIALFVLGCVPFVAAGAWSQTLPESARGWIVFPVLALGGAWSLFGIGLSFAMARRLSSPE